MWHIKIQINIPNVHWFVNLFISGIIYIYCILPGKQIISMLRHFWNKWIFVVCETCLIKISVDLRFVCWKFYQKCNNIIKVYVWKMQFLATISKMFVWELLWRYQRYSTFNIFGRYPDYSKKVVKSND